MASEKITALIEEVKALTVLELSELVKALEEEFGVSAAAMAAPAAGAGAAEEGHAEEMLHDLPPGIREMFISGMCPECWEKTFGGEEDAE